MASAYRTGRWGITEMTVAALYDVLRHTSYDLAEAAARIGATRYPDAEEFARRSILEPPSEEEMLEFFRKVGPSA